MITGGGSWFILPCEGENETESFCTLCILILRQVSFLFLYLPLLVE